MSLAIKPRCESCQDNKGGFFCLLEGQNLSYVDSQKTHSTYKKNAVLFERGDNPEGIYCVLSGVVKVETENHEGKSHILCIAGRGDVLGYRALFSKSLYQARAVVHEESEICFIPRNAVDRLIKENAPLALRFLELLSEDVKLAEERLCSATDNDSAARIANTLLFFESNYSPEKPWTRKEIADWAGTSPETVMRTLSSFEDNKWILSEGKRIHILQSKELKSLSHK